MSKLKTKFQISNLTGFFLFLTILLAPLYVVRFQVGPYPSTLLEVLVGLTVLSWLVERIKTKNFQLPISNFRFPLVLFFFAAVISVVVSPDKRGALGIFKAYFVEPILIYLIIKDTVKSKKDWQLLFSALALSGLWVALLAVLQGLTGWFAFAPWEAAQGRAHAVYNTANAVGLYLGPLAVLILGPYMAFRGGRWTPIPSKLTKSVLYFLLLFFAIGFSQSSGAIIALVVATAYLGLHSVVLHSGPYLRSRLERFWKPAPLIVVSTVLILGAWLFFNISSFTPKNVNPHVRQTSDTLQLRLCLWEGARNLLLDRPLFGAGLSGFKELYSQQYFTCDAEPLEYPHNWVLNFWTEVGIFGLLGFLGVLWVYFKGLGGHLALGFSAAMLYWLIHGLVDVPYFKNDLALEFFVLLGLGETLGFAF